MKRNGALQPYPRPARRIKVWHVFVVYIVALLLIWAVFGTGYATWFGIFGGALLAIVLS